MTRFVIGSPAKPPVLLRTPRPVTRLQWAEYYATRNTAEALQMCFWYLILHLAFEGTDDYPRIPEETQATPDV